MRRDILESAADVRRRRGLSWRGLLEEGTEGGVGDELSGFDEGNSGDRGSGSTISPMSSVWKECYNVLALIHRVHTYIKYGTTSICRGTFTDERCQLHVQHNIDSPTLWYMFIPAP